MKQSLFISVFGHAHGGQELTFAKLWLTVLFDGYFRLDMTSVSSIELLHVARPVLGNGNIKINKTVLAKD